MSDRSFTPQDIKIYETQKLLRNPRLEVQSARLRLMGYTLLAFALLLTYGRWHHYKTETAPGSEIDTLLAPKTVTVYYGHIKPSEATCKKLAQAAK